MSKIAFIGAGNIAKAILGGYYAANPTSTIYAADPMASQLESLPDGINTGTDNQFAVSQAETIVLCVKPNMMAEICQNLSSVSAGKLFISVAAGITSDDLQNWLGTSAAVVRSMPNTPALVGEGMTGLFARPEVSEVQRQDAEKLLGAVGKVCWFDREADLDLVTAVSGSGPAYFFLMIEAMQEAAVAAGLTPDVARMLTLQTALGAAKMAATSEQDAGVLRQNVTSPGGTTAAALDVFNGHDFKQIVAKALAAAETRAKELSST